MNHSQEEVLQRLVDKAVHQERRRTLIMMLSLSMLLFAFFSSQHSQPNIPTTSMTSVSSSPASTSSLSRHMRSLLENASSSDDAKSSSKKEKKSSKTEEKYFTPSSESSPKLDTADSLAEKEEEGSPPPPPPVVIKEQVCDCPPPPLYQSGFNFDPRTRKLTIDAATVELTGNLVVRSYLGVGQSIYIGGDPTLGERASELGAGILMLYSPDGGTIAGFETSELGFQIANVTIQGELFQDDFSGGGPVAVLTENDV